MIKDGMDIDPRVFCLVNPYKVNPGRRVRPRVESGVLQQVPTKLIKEDLNILKGEEDYFSIKGIKLEMEEFSNLTEFIPMAEKENSIDELNTPVYELKRSLDFTTESYELPNLQDFVNPQDLLKYENNPTEVYSDNYLSNNQNIFNDFITENMDTQKEHCSVYVNSEIIEEVISPPNNVSNETPMYKLNEHTVFSFDEDDDLGESNIGYHYSNVSSPCDGSSTKNYENRNYSSSEESKQNIMAKLNVDIKIALQQDNIPNTPDVLDSVVSLENERFNILSFIDEKDLTTINSSDIQFQLPTPVKEPLKLIIPKSRLTVLPKLKRTNSRRRKRYDDDDEDYIPTPKKTPVTKKPRVVSEEDTDSDNPDLVTLRSKERTSRTSSISSDCSKESGSYKYRELRDKNNEASRKSRLKRKTKEFKIESEASQLENKNVKLRAEVEELERMVNNLRTNLFKIMLKKFN